jgi:hypothetical protein
VSVEAAVSTVDLPESIVRAAEVQAKLQGVSLEEWISRAVAQHLDSIEGAREFFIRRANGASAESLRSIMDKVPDRPPDPGDELED